MGNDILRQPPESASGRTVSILTSDVANHDKNPAPPQQNLHRIQPRYTCKIRAPAPKPPVPF